MRFSSDFPDKLRSSILLSEVVSKKVALKQRGKEFQGLCPFHNEKSPSFTVNDQKGFYHCFGCGAHGDIIGFAMNTDGLEFKDAVLQLANNFGVEVPWVQSESKEQISKIDREYEITETICRFFEDNLYSEVGKKARDYLKSRGVTGETAKKFRLGFAPNSYSNLINFLRSKGFSEAEMVASGAVSKGDKGIYDKFRNRVIFPINNRKGSVIAFGGRVLSDELPKYLNSAETGLFKKSQVLYNMLNARKAIFDKGYAVIVEGYFDVVSLAISGVENVVAGLGTAVGVDHLKLLFASTNKVVLCLDGDDAGIRAAKKVSELALPLIDARKNVGITFLPQKMDPDDFVKEFGKAEIEKRFEEAVPLSQALYEFTLLDLGLDNKAQITPEDKVKLETELLRKADQIVDFASKKYFTQFFKDKLFSIGRKSFKKDVSAPENSLKNLIHHQSKIGKSFVSDNFAKKILAHIIHQPELIDFREEGIEVRDLQFANEELEGIKSEIFDAADQEKMLEKDEILVSLNEKLSKEIKKMLLSLENSDLSINKLKFHILLSQDLLTHVEAQYQNLLSEIDNVETNQSAITDQKIKEIFDYKESLRRKIISLEQELT